MSCFDDLQTYCGKDILGEWYHNIHNSNITPEMLGYEWAANLIHVFDDITPYAYSTIKAYIRQTQETYCHWSHEELEENYKIITRYIDEKKKEEERQQIEYLKIRRAWKERDKLRTQFKKDEEEFLQYVGYSPCVYVLECCDSDFRPIGIKVGSATNLRDRMKTIKSDISSPNKAKGAKEAGIKRYRPLAYFPTIGENKDISRAYSYKLESTLHIFMERFKNFKRVGNDHFMFTNDDEHFRLYELLEDEETIKDLYAMVENFNDNFSLQQSILETYTKFRYL